MTTISAKIIEDSVCEHGSRLTTMLLRYPRCIHSEFMTHRVFSRNAGSSRAIPVARLIKDIRDDPFIPLHWGANQKGMQAFSECNEKLDFTSVDGIPWSIGREDAWLSLMERCIVMAEAYDKAGYHKQIVNRILEPFAHINVLVTSDKWSNFLALRDHKDAEPHIQILARRIKEQFDFGIPKYLNVGDWHAPFITEQEVSDYDWLTRVHT